MLALPDDLRTRIETRLTPFALGLLERSGAFAAHLHAGEAGVEHLLCTLMEVEDCAARRVVEHAFADPQTLAEEVLALAAGIMVTGSSASLPFSPGGVAVLERARESALQRGEPQVLPAHLLAAAFEGLPPDLRAEADEAGLQLGGLSDLFAPAGAARRAAPGDSFFRHFGERTKRCLSAAARLSRGAEGLPIGPAHLVLACLQEQHELERGAGLSASRMRVLLRGRMRDPTPADATPLEADEGYLEYLANLPAGADSLALLARYHAGGTPEMARILQRHKVTPALLERAAGAFGDPVG